MNKNKEFIIEDGKITNCASNINKMNLFEFGKIYSLGKMYKDISEAIGDSFIKFVKNIYLFIIRIIGIIFAPLVYILLFLHDKKKARYYIKNKDKIVSEEMDKFFRKNKRS